MQKTAKNGPSRLKEDIAEALGEARLVLIDLDGCLAFGLNPHPAAAALIKRLGSRYAILSNNSTETPAGLADILAARGLLIDPQRIILAGTLMIDTLLAEAAARPVALLAATTLCGYAARNGLVLCDDATAEIVALARDTSFTYEKLNGALRLLHGGADFIISNPDLTHPGEDAAPVIETGALLALFRAGVPGLEPRVIGKPEPLMFETALARFGVDPADALMIGDNPATDGVGAERAGIASILVGNGSACASIADLV